MTANLFEGNNATIGGALRWTLVEPIITPDKDQDLIYIQGEKGSNSYGSLTFTNNEAGTYGPDVAGLARELIRFNDENEYLKYLN